MANTEYEIEFAFGLKSGTVLFVMAGCLTEALSMLARCSMLQYNDRRPVDLGISARSPASDSEEPVKKTELLWWTVFVSTDESLSFAAQAYPTAAWLPSHVWLERTGRWVWGLRPHTSEKVPADVLSSVLAAERLK